MKQPNIENERLLLVNCDQKLLETVLLGRQAIEDYLQVRVPENWTEFGELPFQYAHKKVQKNPQIAKWWTYLPILKEEKILVGSCGYKGAPHADGMIELGYEVAQDFRNQGIATEIVQLLIQYAMHDKSVQYILAHTLAQKNASVRVLEKVGFRFVQEIADEEHEKIWQWKLKFIFTI